MTIIPVILSGGGGTRLWPVSTAEKPKQFLALTADRSMFQLTLDRVSKGQGFAQPMIVSGISHAALIAEQLADSGIEDAMIILEPCARNTAPAIALAALAAPEKDAMLLVMPSDHIIADVGAFHAATQAALPMAAQGWMVTYGIEPTGPETGYGYIQMGMALENGIRRVDRFVEKPDRPSAEAMLLQGNFSWNGGIFLFRADIFLEALSMHAPEMLAAAQQAFNEAKYEGMSLHPNIDAFAACPSDSIDYAVMEKADRVAVVPVNMGWSDVGSWDALYDIGSKDENGNSLSGNIRLDQASRNLVRAEGIRVSVHGVEDLIIVANGTEIVILPRGTSQKVRDFAKD
jgi:mannose-1-phosphate guanylyltransferase